MDNYEQSIYDNYFQDIEVEEEEVEEPVSEEAIEKTSRLKAEGNIMDLDTAMNNIKILIDYAFAGEKVVFGQEYNKGDGSIPTITYSIVNRSYNEVTPKGARAFNVVKEYANGKPTGDNFEIYRDFFDCSVEFNFFANNTSECSKLKNKFEEIMHLYKGSLKRAGLSDICFLYEINPSHSTKAIHNPKATLVYYLQIQRITSVRTSSLHKVITEIEEMLKEENPVYNDILDNLSSDNLG